MKDEGLTSKGNQAPAPRTSAMVYDQALTTHELSPTHPMKPVRIRYAYELAEAAHFFDPKEARCVKPRPASEEELALFHETEYINAVKALDAGLGIPGETSFGFNSGDNPVYPGIFEAQALSAGSTMVAAHLVAEGSCNVAFAPAGGLHHAMPRRASGFCVFNDPAMAIRWLVEQGLRVAYIDIDCHHGDGVQHAFYDSADVLTISLHESGQFLFPGTGFVDEVGSRKGEGYSVNVPLAPYTGDRVYSKVFDAIVPALVRAFEPDVLFTQLGMDTHFRDPITHLRLTVQEFARTVARLSDLARECGKWVASGGGGYDLGAVARGWAMAFAVMAGVDIPDRVPDSFTSLSGLSTFADPQPEPVEDALEEQIDAFATRSIEEVQRRIFPRFGLAV